MTITQRIYPNFIKSALLGKYKESSGQFFNQYNQINCTAVLCGALESFDIQQVFPSPFPPAGDGIIIDPDPNKPISNIVSDWTTQTFNIDLISTPSAPENPDSVELIKFEVPALTWTFEEPVGFRYAIIAGLVPGGNPDVLSDYIPFMHFDFGADVEFSAFTLTPSSTCKPTLDFTPITNPVCSQPSESVGLT